MQYFCVTCDTGYSCISITISYSYSLVSCWLFRICFHDLECWNDLIICSYAQPKKQSNLIQWKQYKILPVFRIGKYWLSENLYQDFGAKGMGTLGEKLVRPPFIWSVKKLEPRTWQKDCRMVSGNGAPGWHFLIWPNNSFWIWSQLPWSSP